MKRIALVFREGKNNVQAFAERTEEYLHSRGIGVMTEEQLKAGPEGAPGEMCPDLILSLGGDGTLLRCVRYARLWQAPLTGFNLGNLGFLTEGMPEHPKEAVDRLLAGEYSVEERHLIRATLIREGKTVNSWLGMNDVVISRNGYSRLMELGVLLDHDDGGRFMADGMIIATPTGSTGYSLSAGGPIVAPGVNCLLVTPICAHTLSARPMVVAGDTIVTVTLATGRNQIGALELDGQWQSQIRDGDQVQAAYTGERIRLIHLQERSFFRLVRGKLNEWSLENEK